MEWIGTILGIVSFVMFAFMFHWINVIKIRSDEQVAQNKRMIELLEKIEQKLEK